MVYSVIQGNILTIKQRSLNTNNITFITVKRFTIICISVSSAFDVFFSKIPSLLYARRMFFLLDTYQVSRVSILKPKLKRIRPNKKTK